MTRSTSLADSSETCAVPTMNISFGSLDRPCHIGESQEPRMYTVNDMYEPVEQGGQRQLSVDSLKPVSIATALFVSVWALVQHQSTIFHQAEKRRIWPKPVSYQFASPGFMLLQAVGGRGTTPLNAARLCLCGTDSASVSNVAAFYACVSLHENGSKGALLQTELEGIRDTICNRGIPHRTACKRAPQAAAPHHHGIITLTTCD
jgi:hypothetical protein